MDTRIRIVFGINDFLVGGMQRQLAEQLKHYDTRRFAIEIVTLFTFPGQQDLYEAIPVGFPVHRLAFKGWWDMFSWVRLYRLLRTLNPDVVVSSLFFSNTVFRVMKPFIGYQSLAREHNTYMGKPAWQRAIDRALAPRSYRIIAVSQTVAQFTAHQERIPEKRFMVISNGIDVQGARDRTEALPSAEDLKTASGFAPSDRVLVSVARLMPQKNHRLLLEGFRLFRMKHPEFRLAIVGDGPLRSMLESRADEDVRFFGHQDDVWPFYRFAEALVSTSDIEGMSNVMLEALASGLPIVATRTAGTDELVTEGMNGFFIQKSTPEALAAALDTFVRADRTALISNATAAASRFDIHGTVAHYQSIFEEAYGTHT